MGEVADNHIEKALQGESMRPAPPHLFLRVKAKISVLAAIQQEHRQFQLSLLPTVLLLIAMWGPGIYLLIFPEQIESVWRDYPGVMGYGDYLSLWLPISLTRLAGLAMIVTGVPLGIMTGSALIRLCLSRRLLGQTH